MKNDPDALYPDHLAELRVRMDQALAAHGFDGVAIYSGSAGFAFLDDHSYPFRTNPHFKHWVPLTDLQQSFVGYVPGQKPILCFHQPADYWHKPPTLPSGSWLGEFSLEVLRDADRARDLLGLDGRRIAFIGEWQARFADWGFAAANPTGLLNELHYDRAVKTPYELECMRRASLMAARGHVAARDAFTSGASEFETHLAYCAAVGQRDEELPYGNIIAFNENAAVLHYQHLAHERDGPRRSFLIDAGAQFRGYAADITRTYSTGDGEFADLVRGMDELQLVLCAAIRSGADYREIHLLAHQLIAGLLLDAGVIEGDVDDAVASGTLERVLSARHRAPARPAGPRHRGPCGRCVRNGDTSPGGPSVPAPDATSRTWLRGDDRARDLLHRPAAAGGPLRGERPRIRLGRGRAAAPVWRDPHRGRRRLHGRDAGEPHARRLRETIGDIHRFQERGNSSFFLSRR